VRTEYRNGDPISLQATGCDGCNPAMINGVLCHEHGCPDAWRDYQRECKWCGFKFFPVESGDYFCSYDCIESYYGQEVIP